MALHQSPAAGTPVAETPPVRCGVAVLQLHGDKLGAEQRVGSFVSSTRLSIYSVLRKAAERNPMAAAADACGEENRDKRVIVQPQDRGSIAQPSSWQGGCEWHSPTTMHVQG